VNHGAGYPGAVATVSTGGSTTGKDVELVVATPAAITRAEVLRALEAIKNHILSNPSPYAQ
jgi:hypothetical protein